MSLAAGDWVLLPSGVVAHVTGLRDAPAGAVACAETEDGRTIETPLVHAELRWRRVPEDGLAVRRALDRTSLVASATNDPVGLVVAALRDAEAGQATVAELKRALTPWPIEGADFERWWKRVQPRLEGDARLDTSRARERRYGLLRDGAAAPSRHRELISGEARGGRRLADAPVLLEARKRAKHHRAGDERAELEGIARLAERRDLDPTDRFLAAELGVQIALWPAPAAVELLGDDARAVDLTRIREKASRDAALAWASQRAATTGVPLSATDVVVQSAVALGNPWAGHVAERIESGAPLLEWTLGFGIPGSPESGPPKYPADLETYGRRVRAAAQLLATAEPGEAAALGRGAFRALRDLPPSGAHARRRRRLLEDVARLFWTAWRRQRAAERARALAGLELPDESWVVVIEAAPREALADLRTAFEDAYATGFASLTPAVRTLAERLAIDPGAFAVAVARKAIARTPATRLALEAVRLASSTAIRADSVTLAGTLAPQDRDVEREIERSARGAAAALLDGKVEIDGPVLFTPRSWRDFAAQIAREVVAAEDAARAAGAERDTAVAELERVRAYANERQEELRQLRAQAGSQAQDNVYRVAANLLRPVASAVAGSYEESDLGALRDRLLAILERARIEELMAVGERQPFDPARHRWAGEGDPTEWVRALSPAFGTRGEGDDGVVLVQARVVAAPPPR